MIYSINFYIEYEDLNCKHFAFEGEQTIESMLLSFLKNNPKIYSLKQEYFTFYCNSLILNKSDNLKKKLKYFFKNIRNHTIRVSETQKVLNYIPNSDPFIKFEDYEWYFRILHKKLSEFFNENYSNLNYDYIYRNNFINFINSKDINEKGEIIEEVKTIYSGTVKEFIQVYNGETLLCYYLNNWLRKCDMDEFEKIKYFVGPFSYSLYKYAYNDSKVKVNCSKKFYRKTLLKLEDFEKYKNNIGELICYPAFTSTSEKDISKFIFQTPTSINVYDIKSNNIYMVLIIDYKCNNSSYPTPCIDVSYFSSNDGEKEYIFPPFSFFRIEKVENRSGRSNDPHIIYLSVPNKRILIEFALKNDKTIYYDKDLNEIYSS